MSFEMNKIFGAVLGAMILAMVSGIIADGLVRPEPLAKPAYQVAGVAEPAAQSGAAAEPAKPEPIGPLLASADANNGKAIAQRQCSACHTFDKGQPNRIGPNLYGVVGDQIGQGRDGYAFSAALSGQKASWSPDSLNGWLTNPQAFAKGTKMTFVGLSKAKDRADVIAYLNSLSDSPKPLGGK